MDPIAVNGDPSDSRMQIFTIGLPVGFTEMLRENASELSAVTGDDYSPDSYSASPMVCIRIFKKDLDKGDIIYKPKSFVFDTRIYHKDRISSDSGDIHGDFTSDLVSSAGISDIFSTSETYSLGASSEPFIPESVSVSDTSVMSGIVPNDRSYGLVSEFNDLYDEIPFSVSLVPPIRGYTIQTHVLSTDTTNSDSLDNSLTLNSLYPESSTDHIKKNHMQDLFLKKYLKTLLGIDVSEKSFQLFKKGTSILSDGDGAGLGTGLSDYELIDEVLDTSSDHKLSDEYPGDGEITSYRLSILKMIQYGIENNILGDFDVSSETANNIISKLRQSSLFSAEKYFNQAFLPKIFERVFCILIDPDGFDIDEEASAENGVESFGEIQDDSIIWSYKSDVASFFATAEILPVTYDDGLDITISNAFYTSGVKNV